MNGGKVCREALTKVSFSKVGDSEGRVRLSLFVTTLQRQLYEKEELLMSTLST